MKGYTGMFLVLQHPFADFRRFLGTESGRLSVSANLPLAEPGKAFVRSSGVVTSRRRGGIDEWAAEESYCDASLALRFPNHLGDARFGAGNVKGTVNYAFRRFHSDGTAARLEVGLQLLVENGASSMLAAEWLELLRDTLEIPVRVRNKKKAARTVKLIDAGDILAQHYLSATTNRDPNLPVPVRPQPWWFDSGAPALVVEYPLSCPVPLPPYTRHVLDVPEADVKLSHTWLQFGKQRRCSTWFVAMGEKGDPDAIRRIRIHLLHLHAERECLRLVLLRIMNDNKLDLANNPVRSNEVEQYLNETLHAIEKPKRFGMAQSTMLDAAWQAIDIAIEGQSTSLQHFRRQVKLRVENYIRRANMGMDTDLKEKLKELASEIDKLVGKLPVEKAEKASNDLKILTDEAVSKNPHKGRYTLSAEGLVKAAQTVAEGTMVEIIVKSVSAMIGL